MNETHVASRGAEDNGTEIRAGLELVNVGPVPPAPGADGPPGTAKHDIVQHEALKTSARCQGGWQTSKVFGNEPGKTMCT